MGDTLVAGATFLAGALAVAAAVYTVKATQRSASEESRQRRMAAATRVAAGMTVIRDHVGRWVSDEQSSEAILPWSTFTALFSDVGLLNMEAARLFFQIEQQARGAEGKKKDFKSMIGQPYIGNELTNRREGLKKQGFDLVSSCHRLYDICLDTVPDLGIVKHNDVLWSNALQNLAPVSNAG